ncbi:caspase family protein [Oceanicoccus sp. KOV_DT_Chl]|uniref:caspase family protein n=1 Tax=Oceanicoccus sp. KOV_DT_Chl TaxID=1904639 RepID=UPI001F18B91F|nr:caspase family protein [Oceanicoccus sp. KOV_DT_Chl]
MFKKTLSYTVIRHSLLSTLLLSALTSNAASLTARETRIAELQVVDCLLPGQMRMLGNRSYMTPRRPATLTAAECQIRGGEYVAYDRADFKTSLNVWMPTAEQGDADAQVNVGEIFEKGVGGTPNYEAALIWYQKAAAQNNKRAQFNIGTLYEQGLGVEKDSVMALSWYRKAWGLPEDSLVFQSAVDEQQKELLTTINKDIRKKDLQISVMKQQIAALSKTLSKQKDNDLKEQVGELQALVNELEQENKAIKSKKATLEKNNEGLKLRTPTVVAQTLTFTNTGKDVSVGDINFGKYYALVIGIEKYSAINNLDTPVNDINTIAEILTNDYGFQVQKVINADDVSIMEAINNINEKLTENDNLLIFYAGHGARLQTGELESGYWLPSNADAPPRDTFWVSNEFVTRHLTRFNAKRVLVVADSCYAGLLSSAPGFLMMGKDGTMTDEYIKYKAGKRSRLLLASGGDKPVLDGVGGNHSVFTQAFIDVLKGNQAILSGPQLYMQVRQKVVTSAKEVDFDQNPVYKTIKGAGHEVGDFFFIPKSKS